MTYLLWPALLYEGLRAARFFSWVYGHDVQAELMAGVPQGGTAKRINLWVNILSVPLSVISIPVTFHFLSGTRPYQLGLSVRRLGQNVLVGLVSALCVVPVIYLILGVVAWLQKLLTDVRPEEHPITELIRSGSRLDLALSALAALVAAPIIEEFLFRGILQPWVRGRPAGGYVAIAAALFMAVWKRWPTLHAVWTEHGWHGAWPELLPAAFVLVMVPGYLMVRAKGPPVAGAVYATSLLFGAVHSFAWPSPVPLFFLALALGAVAYRTQSLVPSVAMHALFNSVAWVFELLKR